MGLTPLAQEEDSNTTFVKVKYVFKKRKGRSKKNSNTTFVKVKCAVAYAFYFRLGIQIQHLLKLNDRKINLYDFIVLLKVLINKDFTYFLPAIMRFEGI